MKSFKEFIGEGKEEAAFIRTVLKKELGLTSRDVSVKARSGGYSSSVNVSIKTTKALALRKKIEKVGESQESYERDYASGEILSGGNTFIFVDLDYKFRKAVEDKIQAEFEKQTKNGFEEGDSVVLYNTFNINRYSDRLSYASMNKSGSSSVEIRDLRYVGGPIMQVIAKENDDSLYAKIK